MNRVGGRGTVAWTGAGRGSTGATIFVCQGSQLRVRGATLPGLPGTGDLVARVVDSVRLWLHPTVFWALIVLYARWVRLLGNYVLNRAVGAPVDEMDPKLLDPRAPLRQVREKMGP